MESEDNSIEIQRRSSVTPQKEILTPSFSMDDDVKLLDDEQFDFDLNISGTVSLLTKNNSPKSEESDEEIFIGSVGLRETCAAKVAEEAEKEADELKPMSPLTAHQMVELFMEAQKVAIQIESTFEDSPSGPSPRRCSPRLNKRPKVSPQKTLRLAAASGSFKNKQHIARNSTQHVAHSNKEQEDGNLTPQLKSLKPFSLDFKSPVTDDIEIKVDNCDKKENDDLEPGKNCEKKSLLDSGKDWKPVVTKPSGLKRSRSLRAPMIRLPGSQSSTGLPSVNSGIKRSNSICSPLGGSLLKRPIIKKRKNDSSESSLNSSQCSTASDRSQSKSKLALPQNKCIQKPGSALGTSKSLIKGPKLTKPSPCMKYGSNGQSSDLNIPQVTLGGVKPSASSCQKVPSEKKPSMLKGPFKRLEMLKPGSLQMKKIAVKSNISKPETLGPLKATAPAISEASKARDETKSLKSPVGKRPLTSSVNNISTPVKRDKVMAPKKLMTEDAVFTTPKKSASSVTSMGTPKSVSMSSKRRSFLPTPGRISSVSSCNSSLYHSSMSSTSSMDSSPKPKRPQAPAVGTLIYLGDANENSSPSCVKPNTAKVQHTPMLVKKKDSSGWTPVRKKQAQAGEEYFVCTKHKNK